jgi:plastocyanin
MINLNRREVLQVGGLWVADLALGRIGWGAGDAEVIEIRMRSDPAGSHVVFAPSGLLVRPGQGLRWVNEGNNVHTATAYHPANNGHALRMPPAAEPWDSGYLINPGDSFEVRLTVEGIYDYYCTPHEAAGMVGRIIVVKKGEVLPATFAPYPDDPGNPEWEKVPEAALRAFPPIEAILKDGRVALTMPEKRRV